MTPAEIYATLWWLEYCDAVEAARKALARGIKLQALELAILAHKTRARYEQAWVSCFP